MTPLPDHPGRSQRPWARSFQQPIGVYAHLEAEGTLSPVYIAVPTLIEARVADLAEHLVWQAGENDPVVDVRWCLDAFAALAEADEQQIMAFARKFGPLLGSRSHHLEQLRHDHIAESIQHWRAMANALASLLAVASDCTSDKAPEEEEWLTFQMFPEIINRLESGEANWHKVSMKVRRGAVGDGFLTSSTQKERLRLIRAIANDVLAAAGVRADSGFSESGAWSPTYELPGFRGGHSELEASSPVVDGLLPILALQAVGAMRDNRVFRCDGCHRIIPLPQGARRPRKGIPFYGDHEACRRDARLKTKRESKRRRYWRRRESAVHGDVENVRDRAGLGTSDPGNASPGLASPKPSGGTAEKW